MKTTLPTAAWHRFKRSALAVLLALPVLAWAAPSTTNINIHVDQFGYRLDAKKIAVIGDPQIGYNAADAFNPGATMQVRRWADDTVVFEGPTLLWNAGAVHDQSGDICWHFDFSSVTTAGSYYLYSPSAATGSDRFEIAGDPYRQVAGQAVRMFFYQRIGIAKSIPNVDQRWADGAAFTRDNQDPKARLISDLTNPATERNLSGGWFDAGDTNKYTAFTWDAIQSLLLAYEENPDVWGDDHGIPESGNGIPDLIDEIKWETDWLLRMQEPNGSVLNRVHDVPDTRPAGTPSSPASLDQITRAYGAASTRSTIASADMYAHAAIVFRSLGRADTNAYAAQLEAAAIAAWNWVLANPNVIYNDTGFGTRHENPHSETTLAVWKSRAAAKLFVLTGDTTYRDYFDANYRKANMFAWNFSYPFETIAQDALLYYSRAPGATPTVVQDIKTVYTNTIINGGGNLPRYLDNSDAYRAYMGAGDYTWGSNRWKSEKGNMFASMLAYGLDPANTANYSDAAAGYIHYIHGVNPIGLVYLTNMRQFGAERSANEMYHHWFSNNTEYDNALTSPKGPPPGYLTGGANPKFKPDASYVGTLEPPQNQPAQKAYKDWNTSWPQNSWEVTEPAIYYQAAYIRLLGHFLAASSADNPVVGVPPYTPPPPPPPPPLEPGVELVRESFDYTAANGTLVNGLDGGEGFASAYTATTPALADGLTYPGVTSNGKAARFVASSLITKRDWTLGGTAPAPGTYWYSMLVRPEANAHGTFVIMKGSMAPDGQNGIGFRLDRPATGSTAITFKAWSPNQIAGTNLSFDNGYGATYLIVGKAVIGAGTADSTNTIWVNPDIAAVPATAGSTVTIPAAQVATLATTLGGRGFSSNTGLVIDEVRIGTSFLSVTTGGGAEPPPPAPAPGFFYEAEKSVRSGGVRVGTAVPDFTGTGYLTNFVPNRGKAVIPVNFQRGGTLDLYIGYRSASGSSITVKLGGVELGTWALAASTAWTEAGKFSVPVAAGSGELEITSTVGGFDLDYLDFDASAHEPLDYAGANGTPINGLNGGNRFAGAFNADATIVLADNLTYGAIPTSGKALKFTGGSQRLLGRDWASTAAAPSDGTYWYSFLFKPEGASRGTFNIMKSTASGDGQNGFGMRLDNVSGTTLQFKAWSPNSVTGTNIEVAGGYGQTYLVVGKIVLDSTGNSTNTIWVNPSTSAEPVSGGSTTTVAWTGTSGASSLRATLGGRSFSGTTSLIYDEIRIGSNFSEVVKTTPNVTPPPPPPPTGFYFEAENSGFSGGVRVETTIPGYQGSGYLTNFAPGSSTVILPINLPRGGNFGVYLGYRSVSGASITVKIGATLLGTWSLPASTTWTEAGPFTVTLPAGVSNLEITSTTGGLELDYIDIDGMIYDGFDYTVGTALNGLNGGNGFSAAYNTSGVKVVDGLEWHDSIVSSGEAIQLGRNETINRRDWGPTASAPANGTYWYSFIYKPENGSRGTFNMFNSTSSTNGQNGFGIRTDNDTNTPAGTTIRVQAWSPENKGGAYLDFPSGYGKTYFILGKVVIDSAGTSSNTIWVNPDLAVEPLSGGSTITAPWAGASAASSLRSSLGARNFSDSPTMTYDEVRIGNTFADVVKIVPGREPPPPPPVLGFTFQAEYSFRSGGVTRANSIVGYQGSGYITGFSDPNSSARIPLNLPYAGTYWIYARYRAAAATATSVAINGVTAGTLNLPAASGWSEAGPIAITAPAGLSELTISGGSGFEMDLIDFEFIYNYPDPSLEFQAENGALYTTSVETVVAGYTGIGYVTGFATSDAHVNIPINVVDGGAYRLFLTTAQAAGLQKKIRLVINERSEGEVTLGSGGVAAASFTEYSGPIVYLRKGFNLVKIVSNQGGYELDKFRLEPIAAPAFNLNTQLLDPAATPEANLLYSYLRQSFGQYMLSGQTGDQADFDYITQITGKDPAIYVGDFMRYSLRGSISNPTAVDIGLDWQVNKGGVVSFQWHWFAPINPTWTDGRTSDLASFRSASVLRSTATNVFDISKAVTPGTVEYALAIADIDRIAVQLGRFSNARVPILWRPLHEADGGWFWWGGYEPPVPTSDPNYQTLKAEPTKKLWRMMYDRLVNHHGLHNLIWVWNSTRPEWYPGDDVVDIVSTDIYNATRDYWSNPEDFHQVAQLGGYRKIVALAENGALPDVDAMWDYGTGWSWFNTWSGSFIRNEVHNEHWHMRRVFQHPRTVNRDNLPELRVSPLVDAFTGTGQTGTRIALVPGAYKLQHLVTRGATGGVIQSLRIQPGYGVMLYPEDNYGGTPVSFNTDVADLAAAGFSGPVGSIRIVMLPVVTSFPYASGMYGQPFSYTITAINAPALFSASGLPTGLTVNPFTGEISGIVGATGTFNATIYASNAAGTAYAPLTLTVAKAPAVVSVGEPGKTTIVRGYDGLPQTGTVTTQPGSLNATYTYNGSAEAPVMPGSYAVTAMIDDPNYEGTANGALVIGIGGLVRHAPVLNADVEGSIQVLLPESATLNGGAMISGDLLVPGQPNVRLNGNPTYGGTLDWTGAATPTNYTITLNGNAVLRHVVRRVDALAMPTVDAPPAPTGTRTVNINKSTDLIGDFATIKHLTLNGNVGAFAIPAGTYGNFTANSGGELILGVAGATEPAVYNLQSLTLNSHSRLIIAGPVILTVANGINLNSHAGAVGNPEWLTLRVANGGVTLNSQSSLAGHVLAPKGTVTINSDSTLTGSVTADRLTLNGNGLLIQKF